MANIYLIHRVREEDRNSSGIHSALVTADTEEAARTLVNASLPNGETRFPASFAAVPLGTLDGAPGFTSPLFLEGDAVSRLGFTRGGNAI